MMKFYKTHRLKKGTWNKIAHAAMHQIIQQGTEGKNPYNANISDPWQSIGHVTGNIQGWSESKNRLLH